MLGLLRDNFKGGFGQIIRFQIFFCHFDEGESRA
jgi:hypothetical protein